LAMVGWTIGFLERRKIQRKLEQFEAQQRLERERARIARDIHDDVGASLSEIGLLSEFAQRDATVSEQTRADVQKIARKARSCTQALDEIVWAVNPRNDTLEGFVIYACAYAEEQLRLADIRCRLGEILPLPARVLRADLRHHLFLAFKEAINNVLKHAQASQVEIQIDVESDCLSVLISDNGRGFTPHDCKADLRNGNGLMNMKERLESMGGSFECVSTPGSGTRVKLTVKLD
jgi:signal transduction histidine kinase